ncbi:MAG: ABC transporter substrate-binding protein [Candidatus Binatia bacterium]
MKGRWHLRWIESPREALSAGTPRSRFEKRRGAVVVAGLVGLTLFLVVLLPSPFLAAQNKIHFVTWKPQIPRVWQRAIADFEARNPGTKIVREVGPASATEFHDLVTQKLKNHDPEMDVFFMDVIWPAEFAAAGWALSLDRVFTGVEQQKFLDAPIRANTYEGGIYGIPVFVDAGLLYYRKDLLRRYGFSPPRTWPELVKQAKAILAKEKAAHLTGFSGQFKQYEGLICNMMEFILSNGGSLWDEKKLQGRLHGRKAEEAVKFVRDEIIRGISHRGVLAYQESESLALFTQGKAIFHRNWPYAWAIANDPGKSKVAGEVGMMPLPSFPGGKSVATLGGWQLGISRFSRKPGMAWKFISFMTNRKVQKRIALVTGRAPARKALYRDPEVLKKHPQLRSLWQTFVRAVPRPRTPVYTPLSNVMQRYFSSAIAVPDSDIDQLAHSASKDMNKILGLLKKKNAP